MATAPQRPAAPVSDYSRALTPIEITIALLAGAGGFAVVQLMGLLGAGGA
jgi:hypothetical protein